MPLVALLGKIVLAVHVSSRSKSRHVRTALATLLGLWRGLTALIVCAKKRTHLVRAALAVHPDVSMVPTALIAFASN